MSASGAIAQPLVFKPRLGVENSNLLYAPSKEPVPNPRRSMNNGSTRTSWTVQERDQFAASRLTPYQKVRRDLHYKIFVVYDRLLDIFERCSERSSSRWGIQKLKRCLRLHPRVIEAIPSYVKKALIGCCIAGVREVYEDDEVESRVVDVVEGIWNSFSQTFPRGWKLDIMEEVIPCLKVSSESDDAIPEDGAVSSDSREVTSSD